METGDAATTPANGADSAETKPIIKQEPTPGTEATSTPLEGAGDEGLSQDSIKSEPDKEVKEEVKG